MSLFHASLHGKLWNMGSTFKYGSFICSVYTGEPLKVSNFWSSDTLFGILSTFEYVLFIYFNCLTCFYLSLGNKLCFIAQFQTLMIQVFVKDWHGKTHMFRLPKNATTVRPKKTDFNSIYTFLQSLLVKWSTGPKSGKS